MEELTTVLQKYQAQLKEAEANLETVKVDTKELSLKDRKQKLKNARSRINRCNKFIADFEGKIAALNERTASERQPTESKTDAVPAPEVPSVSALRSNYLTELYIQNH